MTVGTAMEFSLIPFLLCLLILLVPCSSSMYRPKGEQCTNCCAGPPGAPGIHGSHGQTGATGNPGSKGERGEKGYLGDKGIQGPKGEIGYKGEKGKRGQKGKCGVPGKDGGKGQRGPMGAMGPKGDKGSKGERPIKTPKISFFVTRTSKFGPVQQDTTIEFDKVFTNDGNAFDKLTSHFVCSTNGTYVFNAHILSQEDRDAFVMIMLNEQPQIPLHGDHRSGYGVASNVAIFHLIEGDHVWLRLKNNSAISNDASTFSGYLIYTDD